MRAETTAAHWRISSYSGSNNNCVECGVPTPGVRAVRDTKDRRRAPLLFPSDSWTAFLRGLGEDDRS